MGNITVPHATYNNVCMYSYILKRLNYSKFNISNELLWCQMPKEVFFKRDIGMKLKIYVYNFLCTWCSQNL